MDELSIMGKKTLQTIVSRTMEKTDVAISTAIYKILCKLLFESGQILIDKLTGKCA